MSSKRVIYFLLATYLVGNLLLIFIQYNWGKNLNTLIKGNEKLVNEFTVTSQLKVLERDILSIESRIRGTISTSDTAFVDGLEEQIAVVESNLNKLKTTSDDDTSVQYLSVLERLVHDKLQHSWNTINTYYRSGKVAAERVIATQRGKRLTDSIMLMARNIELSRQYHLATVTTSIDISGENALHLGVILIASVLVCGAFIFWYIINTIRRQNGLILELNRSEKKVREAALIKEQFLANMSHEIRTPMNAILGFTNLLQRKKRLDEEARQYVQTIQRSGENLLTIINDILDLSKIEAGMMRIEPAPFSIRSLIHSVETMIKPKAAEKGLQLTSVVDESVPEILEGDAVRLTQILVNLLGNAVKFTEEGSVAIMVTNQGQTGSTVKVGISVADTGIGIEKEKLNTIFERFQQAEGSVTRKYGGTGLGLAIAKDLVQLQGGSIEVESEMGKGTTFHVVIPYEVSIVYEGPTTPSQMVVEPEPHVKGLRVLVVEDNEINQHLIQAIFRHWQVTCEVANNGREALQRLREHSFDLILMDIQMPEMDGYTTTQKIRTELGLNTPIIAMTAHAMAGEREKCLSYGMSDYIAKPVREEKLYELILLYVKTDLQKSNSQPAKAAANGFQFIHLDYMREVSGGDVAYEKIVTEQFLELLPDDLRTLEEAWQQKDIPTLRRVAHNMKTTISVMGLNDRLQPYLNALEYEELTEESFSKTFAELKAICEASLQEAKIFYTSLA
jgi:signal transduction histidine kinase/CheY-like chemotaxis protein